MQSGAASGIAHMRASCFHHEESPQPCIRLSLKRSPARFSLKRKRVFVVFSSCSVERVGEETRHKGPGRVSTGVPLGSASARSDHFGRHRECWIQQLCLPSFRIERICETDGRRTKKRAHPLSALGALGQPRASSPHSHCSSRIVRPRSFRQ